MHLAARSIETCKAGAEGEVIPVDIASAKAVAIAQPLRETEWISLAQAIGRVLAVEITASVDLPRFDNSAMDGYAIRLGALEGSAPWTLPVFGRLAAGEAISAMVPPRAAVRIFTGAEVPEGFDAVVMQEHCERVGDHIVIHQRPREGQHIRRRSEDLRAGNVMLERGVLLTPQRLALLASQGLADIEVVRRVRIGLISTGTELRDPGSSLGPGQIYNTNRVMLASMLSGMPWAELLDYGIVPDRRDALEAALGRAAATCDVLVTTGGVSAGEEDHVVAALDSRGGKLDVLKVAMRPGKPVKIGLIGPMLFAGLPGNPNATLVTFRQIALPAIRAVAGVASVSPDWHPALAGFDYTKRGGRTEFAPVRIMGRDEIGRPVVDMLAPGSSASLMAMANADGIALLPPDVTAIKTGMPLKFEPFC